MGERRGMEHWRAIARLGFERHLLRLKEGRRVSEHDISRSTGFGPSRVRSILRGETEEIGLDEMILCARAVGGVLSVTIHADAEEVSWVLTVEEAKQLLSERERKHGADAAFNSDPPTVFSPAPAVRRRAGGVSELPKGGGLWIAWGKYGGWGWVFSRYLWHLSLGRVAVGFLRHDVDVLIGSGLAQVDPVTFHYLREETKDA